MTPLLRIGIVLGLALAGCATPPSTVPSAVVTSSRMRVIPAAQVGAAIVAGKSTRADVAAALGETLAIRFDTGFELWVYRLADGAPAREKSPVKTTSRTSGEFVVLFAPSGLVMKTRIRPASPENGSERDARG